ncbi:MAG: vitamin K epoxide reductase family protein [Actinomycetota bacterium]
MIAAVALTVLVIGTPGAAAADPVVRAVLFYLPTCGHCHYVIEEVLPGVFEAAGGTAAVYYDQTLASEDVAFYLVTNGRLEMLMVNSSVPGGGSLFEAATEALGIESTGVPRLVVGDQVLIGSVDIPDRFPAIVSDTLEAGGTIDWPAIPGLAETVASVPIADADPTSTTTTVASSTTEPIDGGDAGPPLESESMWDRFGRDRLADSLAVAVLGLMIVGLAVTATRMRHGASGTRPSFIVGGLALAGLGIALYLTVVEVGGSEAVCGPVGDCNAVQQSDYARLFGFIPVGVLGAVGYAATLITWGFARLGRGRVPAAAAVALFAGSVAGVVLSVYLTFLEPFVIGATCRWCLGSALIVTILMWLTARPAAAAWPVLRSLR